MVEEDAFGKMRNFETKKIFEETKVFAFEVGGKDGFEGFNLGEVIFLQQEYHQYKPTVVMVVGMVKVIREWLT